MGAVAGGESQACAGKNQMAARDHRLVVIQIRPALPQPALAR
jgi:hypothetical protein